MNKHSIAVITGSRAEYGIMKCLIRRLYESDDFETSLIVTGSHLSHQFQYTKSEIEHDGIPISAEVEMLVDGDTHRAMAKSIGLGIISFSEQLSILSPDLIIILGDRYEILAAAHAAHALRIPIAHIHGGEISRGALDNEFRHCISMLSSMHLVAHQQAAMLLKTFGADGDNIFVTGAPSLENLNYYHAMTAEHLSKRGYYAPDKKNILLTYHPETATEQNTFAAYQVIIKALQYRDDLHVVVTGTNADPDGRQLNHYLKSSQAVAGKFVFSEHLGVDCYFSLLSHFDCVIGNSSSGLIEVPSFSIPTINIGQRQEGRLKPKSVINCSLSEQSIIEALKLALSGNQIAYDNPYAPCGFGVSEAILTALRKFLSPASYITQHKECISTV